MTRPTIRDLALAANVSVSTVNRVLSRAQTVKDGTIQRVKEAVERIGYYGLGTIRSQIVSRRPKLRFGFLLHQPNRTFYKMIGAALKATASAVEDYDIDAEVLFAEDLSPQFIAGKLLELGQSCNAVGVVSAVHPLVTQAVGRTSAWAFHHFCKSPGKIGILVGNHRYRCQEMNESGFRSYFREFAPDFRLLEPISTFETNAVPEEMTEKLIKDNPALIGFYISGGGITGAMRALRASGRAGKLIAVGYELMDTTRAGLLDGTLTMVIAHPLQKLAQETISGMIRASKSPSEIGNQTTVLPFDIYTRENI
jgi:LacI family transcriptional regulator